MMNTRDFPSPGSSSDTPDLDLGALGFEMVGADDNTSAGEMPTAVAERIKPQPPRKKAHLDEVFRLRKKFEQMSEEKEQAEEMVDMMAQDLCLAQEKLQENGDILREREAELLKCKEELNSWRDKAQNLSVEVQEEKQVATEIKGSVGTQEIVVTSKIENESQKDKELLCLRGQVVDLAASMAKKEAGKEEDELQNEKELAQLRVQVEQLTASLADRDAEMKAAAAAVSSETEQLEARLRDSDERATSQIAELQKRAQETEVLLQEHASRMEVELDQENLQKHISFLEAEVQDQRQRCDWFKKNSERLSREIKETRVSEDMMAQSQSTMKRQLEHLKSQVRTLQQKYTVDPMHGTY